MVVHETDKNERYALLMNAHTHTEPLSLSSEDMSLGGSEAAELSPFLTENSVIVEGVICVLLQLAPVHSVQH